MEQIVKRDEGMEIMFEGIDAPEVPQGFQVTDLASADWAIGKAKRATLTIREAEVYAQYLKGRVDGWLKEVTAKQSGTIETMRTFLEPWVRAKLEGVKERSIKLINGKAGFRKTPEKIEMPENFVEDAKKLGIKVQVKEYVNKTDVKEYIKSTGHVPEGVAVIPGEDRFYIDVE